MCNLWHSRNGGIADVCYHPESHLKCSTGPVRETCAHDSKRKTQLIILNLSERRETFTITVIYHLDIQQVYPYQFQTNATVIINRKTNSGGYNNSDDIVHCIRYSACESCWFISVLPFSTRSNLRTGREYVFPQLVIQILFLRCKKCHMDVHWASGHLARICGLYSSNITDLFLMYKMNYGDLLVIVAGSVAVCRKIQWWWMTSFNSKVRCFHNAFLSILSFYMYMYTYMFMWTPGRLLWYQLMGILNKHKHTTIIDQWGRHYHKWECSIITQAWIHFLETVKYKQNKTKKHPQRQYSSVYVVGTSCPHGDPKT